MSDKAAIHKTGIEPPYFPSSLPISSAILDRLGLDEALAGKGTDIVFFRRLAIELNRLPSRSNRPASAGLLNLYGQVCTIYRYLIDRHQAGQLSALLADATPVTGDGISAVEIEGTLVKFAELFPGATILKGEETISEFLAADYPGSRRRQALLGEIWLLRLADENPALELFRELFDDRELAANSSYLRLAEAIEGRLAKAPPVEVLSLSLPELLRAPVKASPGSISGQAEYIREQWAAILPPEIMTELLKAFDIAQEEEREWFGGPGRTQVLDFTKGGKGTTRDGYPEYERFSPDADWMSNVVMIAKMVHVWLGQLAKQYGRAVYRLDQVPDEELDRLAGWGFTALWLIGLWERSPASQRIKQTGGNPEAISSAYSLYDYVIAGDLGGEEALANLKERCRSRGIRLASDMVPNHTGIYSKWTVERPDWYVQLDYPPYPSYSFTGPDLSFSSEVSIRIEDGYWDRTDAAVVFKHYDQRNGRTRYIYHGNDGTSTPWNDTAQLNYLIPEVREAVIRTIIHVAHQFPIIRFDAAMTLAKKHYQRLWYPQPGHGSGVSSRAEHGMSREEFDSVFPHEFWREVVDRVAEEVPDTLLLAEAFWLMEGYFVRTLGMHRVYNSAFMNMLKLEENAKYRQTVKNVLEFNPEILKRFVNFMNNPDERTAIEQFGREGKYLGACVLLVTMPGLPMFGHGQVEGFHEKYGMEYKRAFWDEPVDERLVEMHEKLIFPLMRRRWLFSGSENFVFYDFFDGPHLNEDVFAYSNWSGDQKGLIVYHNRFAETSGWVRASTARSVTIDAGETILRRTTLGEALDFNPDGRCYYTFRDYSTGLEYLRSGRELCEQGLFVELAAYEFHAFLDFREIRDDGFGTWGRLCQKLGGLPVANIDEEVKQVRYGREIDLFRELMTTRPLAPSGIFNDSSVGPTWASYEERFNAFLIACAEHLGNGERVGEVASAVARELIFLNGLLAAGGKGKSAARELAVQAVSDPKAQVVIIAWLYLHRIGCLAVEGGWEARSAEILHDFGFVVPVEEAIHSLADYTGKDPLSLEVSDVVLLLRIMVLRQGFLCVTGETGLEQLGQMLGDPLVRRFCLVHESGGLEWCNKERLESLLHFVYLAGLATAGGTAHDSNMAASAMTILHRHVTALLTRAEESGYRLDLLLAEEKGSA
ncbi:MAG: alpha-amylase family glycosyl hydrolase [Geobacteraceae bacterium]